MIEEIYHQENHYSDIDPNYPFSEQDSTLDIIQKISNLQVESILDTADLIDIKTLEQAVDIILGSNKIAVFGLSPNSSMAALFRRKMQAIGKTLNRCDILKL